MANFTAKTPWPLSTPRFHAAQVTTPAVYTVAPWVPLTPLVAAGTPWRGAQVKIWNPDLSRWQIP